MILLVHVLRKDDGWVVMGANGQQRQRDPEHYLTVEKVARHYLWAHHHVPWYETAAIRVLNACEPQMHDRDTSTVILERSAA